MTTGIYRVIREFNELPIAIDPYYTPCISCGFTGDIHAEDCPVDFSNDYNHDDDSTDMSTRGGE